MAKDNPITHPFYAGVAGGFGSTTWEGLVPAVNNQSAALSLSTPTGATEGGGVWGFLAGYEFTRYFAIEANYLHFPNARISFNPISLFSFLNNGMTEFITQTETINLMGKIMLALPNSSARIFSSAGAAGIHREDALYDHWHASPTFGVGLNYDISPHFMGEIAGNYTAGYGEAQLNPTDVYFPFLYSVTVRLAYRF